MVFVFVKLSVTMKNKIQYLAPFLRHRPVLECIQLEIWPTQVTLSHKQVLNKLGWIHACIGCLINILDLLWRRADARNVSFETLHSGQFTLSTPLIILNYLITLVSIYRNVIWYFCIFISVFLEVSQTEFLLTISIQYQADKWWE